MINWQNTIDELIALKRVTTEVAGEKLWPLHLPSPGATEEKLKHVEGILGYPLDPSYRSFLRYVDGWLKFDTHDLFGTDDLLGGPKHAYAMEYLEWLRDEGVLANGDCPWGTDWSGDTYGGVLPAERSLLLLPNLLPIGVNDNSGLVFMLIVKTPAPVYEFGTGRFQDRYPTFEAYVEAAIESNRRMPDLIRQMGLAK